MHLLEQEGDRWRIVVEMAPARRRLFECKVPRDATVAELEAAVREVATILRKRRASDQETPKK